jgi:glycosyltransferase involved in cell wall biosynthesis
MRILLVGSTYYPGSNGQAVFSIRLAEGLAQAGNQVLFVTPADRLFSRCEIINGVTIQQRGSLPLTLFHPEAYFNLPIDFALGGIIDQFQPDIIHIQDHYPISRSVFAAVRRRGLPVVGTNHFFPESILPYLPRFLPIKRSQIIEILWWTMLTLYNQFDLVVTPTETAAVILRRQKIHVPVVPVSCGVDLHRFYRDPKIDCQAVRREFGLDPKRSIFLYVGRLDGEKRVDILIRAFAHLKRDDARLVIVGKGADGGALASLARQLHVEKQVKFTGYIANATLPLILNSVDFFCMPSPMESLCIATLEAMACGLPILAARARALPELVEDRTNGYLFNPNEVEDAARGMEYLLDMGPRREAMRHASVARSRPHGLENTIRRYQEVYRSLIPTAEESAEERVLIP